MYAISENGRESVHTERAMLSLTSMLTSHLTSHFRAQASHDIQKTV